MNNFLNKTKNTVMNHKYKIAAGAVVGGIAIYGYKNGWHRDIAATVCGGASTVADAAAEVASEGTETAANLAAVM